MPNTTRDRGAEPDALLGVGQAAARLGVHPNTIRSWAEAGRLPAFRINARGDRRFRASDLDGLLTEGAAPAETPSAASADEEAPGPELSVLSTIARGVASAVSAAAVCRVAVEALRTHAGYRRVAVYLQHEDGLALATHGGYEAPPPASIEPSDEAAKGEAAGGEDSADTSDGSLRLPLRAAGDLVGVLVVETDPDDPPAAAKLPFLRTVAGTLAGAVHNVQRLGRARRELMRARALRGVTQELTGQLDLSVVLDDIVERTRGLFDADAAGLWLIDEERELPFELAASRGISAEFAAQVGKLTLDSDTIGIRAVREARAMVTRTEDSIGLMKDVYERHGIRTVCLVPLISRGHAVGLLGLYHGRDRAWPEDEVGLAQAFANQAAVAISNARLYHSAADQAARMRSIQDLSARLNRLTDVRAIAEAIVAEASTLADYHDIRIYTIDWEARMCEPVAFTMGMLGGGGDYEERLRVPVGEGSFTGWVAESGEPLLINDALHDPRGVTIAGTDDVEESMLVVPMLYEGHAVGVMVLSQLGSNRFTGDDLQTMSIFAGYAAQAIANASAYERLERQSAELARQLDSQRRLLEINERLLSTLDHGDVLETIADGLRAVVAYDNLSIYRADQTARILVPVFTREQHAEQVSRFVIPFSRGLMGWVVDHGEPVLANDALSDPRALQIPGTPPDPEAVIVVPLVSEGSIIGALNVSRVGGHEVHFSATDFELVKLFAGQASIALRNADEHYAVSLRADTDALTGLGNHGAFQRELGRILEEAEAAPGETRVAMLMMDLDRFKSYNDRFGHPAGDALLHAVGVAIYNATRSDDRVYRYGGDEFALILPGATPTDAARMGDRVRRAVAQLTGAEATPVTITGGVAGYPNDARDRAALVAAADTALYYGKETGEDRVVRADEVPRERHDLRERLDKLARTGLRRAGDRAGGNLPRLAERTTRPANTELAPDSLREALLRMARSFDARGAARRGRADRVGGLAGQIAVRLGCGEDEAHAIELAGRLHGLDERGLAELEPIGSLRIVSRILRDHRALRAGGPRRRRSDEPTLGGHIVGAANAYVEATSARGRQRRRHDEAIEALRSDSPYRADVIDALAELAIQRTTAEVAEGEVRGAA